MEKERREKEEQERQEKEVREAAHQLVQLQFERAQSDEVKEQMRAFGIQPGVSYDISETGYLSGPGWLEPSRRDIFLAGHLEQKLNNDTVLKENFRKQLRCVKVHDKWFVVGLSLKTGQAHVFGLRDPRYVDPSTGEPINPQQLQDSPE